MNAFKIHLQGIKAALSTRMAYRFDFILSMLIMLLVELVAPLITLLIYNSGSSIPGYTIYQALLIQGVFLLSRGVSFPFFFGMVSNTIMRVQQGTLDLLLIKPRSALRMLIVTGFDAEDLGKLIGGIILFSVALIHLPAPSLAQWLEFSLLFILAIAFMFGIAMLLSGIGIVWVGNYRVYDIFFTVTNFGNYPTSIFSKPVQIFTAAVLPIGMLGFFPASVLLGKPGPFMIYSCVSVVVFLMLSFLFFNLTLRKYSSTGG